MRLLSLRLQNFRQHVDTRLTFDRGLTGIIGPNGSGKSTLLEAIAWALYGNPAARGTRDSIRFSRAVGRAPVRVELTFELAGHRYRVLRSLNNAECFLDGGDTPIANTITGVTELLQRRLGMTRAEFFHTYFTGQKELDVMAALGPAERARFLSRVLGYDRISGAQEMARERRRALQAEINGLRQGMADPDAIWRAVAEAEARVAVARTRAVEAEQGRTVAAEQLAALTPRWEDAQAQREQAQQLLAELRVAENEALSLARDLERLDRELEAMERASQELAPLQEAVRTLRTVREDLAALDALAGADARRQALLERVRATTDEQAKLVERAARLESAPALEKETVQQLATLRQALVDVERSLERERTDWARDRQEAETRLEALRTQYAELVEQQERLEGLGEDSPCPTCGRPLGASYRGVLDLLNEQVETVRVDGNYDRQRVEQLTAPPASLDALDQQRRQLQHEVVTAERRHMRIQHALQEAAELVDRLAKVEAQLVEVTAQLAALPVGYDAERHVALRADAARLQTLETQAARVGALIERELATRTERARVLGARDHTRARLLDLEAQRAAIGIDDQAYGAVRDAYAVASTEARRADLDALAAAGEAERARAALEAAEQGRRELARLQAVLEGLETDKRLHDELDRALTDVRTDLNFQLRPELSEIASGFLHDLTDGRYTSLEFDEDYRLLVMEDGLPKPVISGGEEDLCNLVLRLAISQMIAERAGQAFSLLILDEVFGSLDDTRRANVVELLRRLNDRFEQVIVITHIEQVREGLDRLLLVRYDEAAGASVVTAGTALAADGEATGSMDDEPALAGGGPSDDPHSLAEV
ncbi:MAG: AAA family ATPase [Gemmatimonas sp.]|uniref:AAA family ATPase n=1 Tax=Gemmatimonas sp. TaxID=1962908 RepID=UPI00391FC04D